VRRDAFERLQTALAYAVLGLLLVLVEGLTAGSVKG
jgi:hypothetical protein